ncbi:MAG: cell division protein FtsQ/DivIB [Acidimicrobiales bacterium]
MTDQLTDPRPRTRIDPRIRQRRIQVKREEGRRRLRALTVAGAVFGVVVAVIGVAYSPLLAVRHVRVLGASRTSASAIAAAAGVAGHPSMVEVNSGRAAASVGRLPWVGTATVHRHWPSTVTIVVTERTPVAVVGISNGPVIVDVTGRVLAPAGGINLPVVVADGDPALGGMPGGAVAHPVTAGAPGPPGSAVDAIYRPGLAVAAALPATLLARLAKIVVSADATVRLGLGGGGAVILGGIDGLGDKLLAVETVLDRDPVGSGTIDVTVPSAPVVAPQGA